MQPRATGPAATPALPPAVHDQLARLVRGGLPKYQALRDAVVHGISRGALRAGTRLPNEVELAAEVSLGLGTVQRALRMLVDDGAIVRRPGGGSWIADGKAEMEAPLHCRFLADGGHAAERFLPVFPRVLDRRAVGVEGPWTVHLGSRSVLCIERALDIGGEFTLASRFYVDPATFPIFERASLARLARANFKQLITESAGLAVNRVRQYVRFVKADAFLGAVLGAKAASPVACFELFAYAGSALPAYYQELYAPPFSRRLLLSGA